MQRTLTIFFHHATNGKPQSSDENSSDERSEESLKILPTITKKIICKEGAKIFVNSDGAECWNY